MGPKGGFAQGDVESDWLIERPSIFLSLLFNYVLQVDDFQVHFILQLST